jgi:fibronectin type 3 domain-containing protein
MKLIILFIVSCLCLLAQTAPPPPSEYQDLYTMMQSQIAAFDQTIRKSWNGSKPPVYWSAQLESATGNGIDLLQSSAYTGVLSELDGLKALGVKAVTVDINYPLLDSAFDAYGGNAAGFLAFYQQLAQDIHSRGLIMIVESSPVFTNSMFTTFNAQPFYDSLSTAQYDAGRANQALVIAQKVGPDYLTVISEPDTEASQTGKSELGTVSGSKTLLNTIVSAYRASGSKVPLGAGVGTWLNGFDQYITNFAATSVDYIDMHIYPVNKDYLTNALTIANMASAAGKRVAMTEAWSMKVRDNELGWVSYNVLYGRDVYSFWAPLDQQFLQALVDFGYYKQLLFVSPFWTEYFRGYIDYDSSTSGLNFYQLNQAASTVQSGNVMVGVYTSTGHAWEGMILPTRDVTPPSVPVLALQTNTSGLVTVTWGASTDNVGTAGYNVYRDGTLLGPVNLTTYYDTNVTNGTSYRYTISAFDASGNDSALSASLPVTTPDTTPPTTPTNLHVTSVTSSQVSLAWNPSTDNVGVANYRIYRGATASTLSLISTATTTSFTNNLYSSGVTLCYAVSAADARGLGSPQSAPLCVAVPDGSAPTMPKNVSATALSPTQARVTWTASTDNVAVKGYQIQRSTGSNAAVTLGTSTTTSFTDNTAKAGTAYKYTVTAYDAAGNYSIQSVGAHVTMPN